MTGDSTDSEKVSHQHLWGVWPTDLKKEWQRRTRYGKIKYVAMSPLYIAVWVLILIFAAFLAVSYYGLVLVWRAYLIVSSWWPSTYQEVDSVE